MAHARSLPLQKKGTDDLCIPHLARDSITLGTEPLKVGRVACVDFQYAGGPCSIRRRKSFSLKDHSSSIHHVAPASASDFTWDRTDLGFFLGVRPPVTTSNG